MFTRFKINSDVVEGTWGKLTNCTISDVSAEGFKVEINVSSDLSGVLYIGTSKVSMLKEFNGVFSVDKYTFTVTGLEKTQVYYFYIKNTSANEYGRSGIYKVKTTLYTPLLIDIGTPAIDRPYGHAQGVTVIAVENPANATGKITKVEFWANNEMKGVKVATFFEGDPNIFSTRDWQEVDDVPAGEHVERIVDLDVVVGDRIGCYWYQGNLKWIWNLGMGKWGKPGSYIPCTEQTFLFQDNVTFSLYGTGLAD